MNITVYSAVWCGYCHAVKDYLTKKGIAYTEKDVDADPKNAEEAFAKSGQRAIPVVEIDGKIIIGFNQPAIDAALQGK